MSFASFKCAMEQRKSQFRDGFTLIELVAVVAILSIIAVFAVTKISSVAEKAKISAAERDLATLREAFMSEESGYLRDMGNIPGFSLGYLRIANLMMPTNLFGVVESDATVKVGFRVDDPNRVQNPDGCAPHEAFTKWNADAERGWRGPYINTWAGDFPTESARRFSEDASFEERGFFPPLDNLRLPEVFTRREGGCSVYGFPGESVCVANSACASFRGGKYKLVRRNSFSLRARGFCRPRRKAFNTVFRLEQDEPLGYNMVGIFPASFASGRSR